jgi:hypothetical protein
MKHFKKNMMDKVKGIKTAKIGVLNPWSVNVFSAIRL